MKDAPPDAILGFALLVFFFMRASSKTSPPLPRSESSVRRAKKGM